MFAQSGERTPLSASQGVELCCEYTAQIFRFAEQSRALFGVAVGAAGAAEQAR
jgi:hypothetical protein